MIKAIGCDIVELARLNNNPDQLALRVLTNNEINEYQAKNNKNKIEYLAGRFAAKEACIKALNREKNLYNIRQIEILSNHNGAPYLNIENSHVTISHENNYAMAVVVIEN